MLTASISRAEQRRGERRRGEERERGRIILHGLVLNHDCVLTKRGGERGSSRYQAEPDSISYTAIREEDILGGEGEDHAVF